MANAILPSRLGDLLLRVSARTLFLFFAACAIASAAGAVWIGAKFGVSLTGLALALGWVGLAAAALICVRRGWWVALILLVLAVRAAMFLVTDGVLTANPDPRYYATLAREISQGRDFTDIVDGMPLQAHAPRLYSILLAGIYWVSDGSRLAPFALNGIIDALTGLMIFLTGRQLGAGDRQALAAAALYVIWPHIVVSSAIAQKEGLASLMVAACLWTLASSWADGRNRGARYGVFLGLLGLTQPAWILMAAGLPLALLLRHPMRLTVRFLGIAALATILVLTPWIVRNWMATGGFIPLTSSFGWNLYANTAQSMEIPQHLIGLPEAEWNRAMAREAMAVIAANPMGFVLHQLKMIALSFALEHNYYLALIDLRPPPAVPPKDFLLAMQLPLIAMWVGAAWSTRRQKEQALMIGALAIVLLHFAMVGVWFQFAQRHRAYLLPMILVWLSVALTQRTGKTSFACGSGA